MYVEVHHLPDVPTPSHIKQPNPYTQTTRKAKQEKGYMCGGENWTRAHIGGSWRREKDRKGESAVNTHTSTQIRHTPLPHATTQQIHTPIPVITKHYEYVCGCAEGIRDEENGKRCQ